jgi:hypothetical protein
VNTENNLDQYSESTEKTGDAEHYEIQSRPRNDRKECRSGRKAFRKPYLN